MFELLVFIFSACVIGGAVSVSENPTCISDEVVSTIHSCNYDGVCAISISDGTVATAKLPAIGQKICTLKSVKIAK